MTTFLPPSDADVARMRERLMAAVPLQRRRRRRVSLTIGLSIAVLVAGATTAGTVAVQLASAQARNSSFDCYTSTDLDAPHGTTMFQNAAGSPGDSTADLADIDARVKLAVATCEAGYRAVPTKSDGSTTPAAVHVPDPTACLLADGRIAVLPNKNSLGAPRFCDALGLAAPGD
ncbi:hypothetical protein [Humibacter ginsenosidimutans]|uniref:Uncharacterized protein n=1 Tax=Humibacter ginsenosidimutans TaxID=2599293 RepID=A0A5B8M8F8_9MICO|nr:hypothetical protein [Humibacter ginsenosidimutans]QDZ15892.1 hypothetical protein FPZ11_14915 [Humibacter ginsenosidimutans]